MSSNQRTFVSTDGADQKSAVVILGSVPNNTAPTFARVVRTRPPERVISRVDSLVDQLCAELDELEPAYPEERRDECPPFVIDHTRNTFTVLADESDDLVEDDPYNMFVALVKGRANKFEYGGIFHAPTEIFLSPAAKEEAKTFAKYAAHLRVGDLTLGETEPTHREILHTTNQFVACLAWECLTGKSNILRPPRPPNIGPRKKGERKEDFTWARSLRTIVSRWVTKECSGYGNALVHALTILMRDVIKNDPEKWKKILNSKRNFKPSREALKFSGVIPDLNIRQYTNLFSPLEMEEIKSTGLLHTEDELKQLSSRLTTVESIMAFIEYCDSVKAKMKDSRILTTIREIRSARLSVCTELKKERRSSTALNMWDAVSKEYSRPKVRSAFAPGSIHIANGTLEAYSSANISSWIKWNPNEKSYGLDVDPSHESALAIRIATEYIQLMSG